MNGQSIEDILEQFTKECEHIRFQLTDADNNTRLFDVPLPFVINSQIDDESRKEKVWKDSGGYESILHTLENKSDNPDKVYPYEATKGKASVEVVRDFLKKSCFRLMDGHPQEDANTTLLNQLIHYGIGSDCTGFVSRAVARVMQVYGIPFQDRKETLGEYKVKKKDAVTGTETKEGTGFLKNNLTTLCSFKSDTDELTSTTGIIRKVDSKTGREQFEKIEPGDILFYKKVVSKTEGGKTVVISNDFHSRIVIRTHYGEWEGIPWVFFETAESSYGERHVFRNHWFYSEDAGLWMYDKKEKRNQRKDDIAFFHVGTPRAFVNLK